MNRYSSQAAGHICAAFRQEQSETIVARLFELWEKELDKVSGKSETAEAIRYAFTRREALLSVVNRVNRLSNSSEVPSVHLISPMPTAGLTHMCVLAFSSASSRAPLFRFG